MKHRGTRRHRLRVVHVTAELDPFFRTGGLATVTAALPSAQKELGHDVSIVAPFYELLISDQQKKEHGIELIGSGTVEFRNGAPDTTLTEPVAFYRGVCGNGVPVYFIAHKKFFGRRKTLYGKKAENARFYFFNFAVLALLKHLQLQPDIIHSHDWHAGLIPALIKYKRKTDPFWEKTACVYTIHNMAYQLGRDWWKVPSRLRDNGHDALPSFHSSARVERINFAKRAILSADVINTVSETYREEILTKDFGEDLHRILKNREQIVFGIVNGIDYDRYNPLSDPGLTQNYTDTSIDRKPANKEGLQKYFKIKVDPDIPVICMTSRIAEQKGYRLVMQIIEALMRHGVQFVIMGDGEKDMVHSFQKIERKHQKQFRIIPFDAQYETSMYAGSDIILLPSRFEPCGINQLIALRYGCIPVVHHIGGFVDTIEDYRPMSEEGNGFVFQAFDSSDLLLAVARALETHKRTEAWDHLIRSGMKEANSWRIPAQNYIELYKTARKLQRKNTEKNA